MAASERIKAGDFTQLANNYAKYRPSYSKTVLKAILGVTDKKTSDIDFVDVGAGTGIWTRLVAQQHCRSVTAVEPNDAMRHEGANEITNGDIKWFAGSAENTTLPDNCADLVTMASSFHWADFDKATKEFHRLLKKDGHFCMLWNPRLIEVSPLLQSIENQIYILSPEIKRVSSGKSNHVNLIAEKLKNCTLFTDMVYIEGTHNADLTKEQYIGAWKSVNDVRAQLGEEKFSQFINYIENVTSDLSTITCTYQTRAWIVKKV